MTASAEPAAALVETWTEVIRVSEQVGEHLIAAMRGVVGDLGFDPDDPAVRAIIRKRLDQPQDAT